MGKFYWMEIYSKKHKQKLYTIQLNTVTKKKKMRSIPIWKKNSEQSQD